MKNPILRIIVANENRLSFDRLKEICEREGVGVSPEAMRSLASANQVALVDGNWIVLEWWKFLAP